MRRPCGQTAIVKAGQDLSASDKGHRLLQHKSSNVGLHSDMKLNPAVSQQTAFWAGGERETEMGTVVRCAHKPNMAKEVGWVAGFARLFTWRVAGTSTPRLRAASERNSPCTVHIETGAGAPEHSVEQVVGTLDPTLWFSDPDSAREGHGRLFLHERA